MRKLHSIVLAGLLAACGGDSGGTAVDVTDATGASSPDGGAARPTADAAASGPDASRGDAPGVLPGLADEIAGDVVGEYALESVVVVVQQVPVLGKNELTTRLLGLATIARDGDGFSITESGCRVEAVSSGAVKTTIPDGIPRSSPPRTSKLTFRRDGAAVHFERTEVVNLVGVKLGDPLGDPLPKVATDPRVFDQDGDGKPGVTIKVKATMVSGDIYVVQRQLVSYAGTIVGAGTLDGLVTDATEQSVIGASNPLLNSNVPSTPHADAALNTLKLRRLAGSYDCTKLISERGTLFQ